MACEDRNEQRKRILRFLRQGGWHGTNSIIGASGGHTEALRRLRELRKQGFNIVCKCFAANDFRYKLVKE